jgi:hypothetical protein
VPPDLPPNFKLGQGRRTAGIVTHSEWNELSSDGRSFGAMARSVPRTQSSLRSHSSYGLPGAHLGHQDPHRLIT